jgi:hypothetical protein
LTPKGRKRLNEAITAEKKYHSYANSVNKIKNKKARREVSFDLHEGVDRDSVRLHNKYSKNKISKKEINDIISKIDDYDNYLKKNMNKVLKGKKIMKKYGIKVKGKSIEDIAFEKEHISKKESNKRINNIYKKYKADDIEGVLNNMSNNDYNKIPKNILYKDPPDIEKYLIENYKKFK